MLRFLLLVALLTLPVPVAMARWFEFELLAFARSPVDGGSELWPPDPGRPDLFTAEALLPPESEIPGLRRLPGEALRLAGIAERLRRSRPFRVLYHAAWRQNTTNSERSPWVRIGDLPAGGDAAPITTADGVPQPPPLEGKVRFTLRRYLHVDVDLVHGRELAAPATAATGDPVTTPLASGTPATAIPASPGSYWQPFRMRHARRLRSGEIHYLDHPAFGLLLLSTPFTPEGEAEPPPADAATGEGEESTEPAVVIPAPPTAPRASGVRAFPDTR